MNQSDSKAWWDRKDAVKSTGVVSSDGKPWWDIKKAAKTTTTPIVAVPALPAAKFGIDFKVDKQNVIDAQRSPLTIALSGKTLTGSAQYAFIAPVPATPPSASGADSKFAQKALASSYKMFANRGALAGYDSLAGLADQIDGGCGGGCSYSGLGLFGAPSPKRDIQDEILTALASGNLSEPALLTSLRTKGRVSKWSFRSALYQLQKNNKIQRFIALVQASPAPVSNGSGVSSALSGLSGWLFGF